MGLRIGIDQSGTVHKTNDHTVISWCDLNTTKNNSSIYVPKKITSKVHQYLKSNFRSDPDLRLNSFNPKMFSVTLYYLLRDNINRVDHIVIEDEYPGNMPQVINDTCNWFRAEGKDVSNDLFEVQNTDRKFNAHRIANLVREQPSKAKLELDYWDFYNKMLPSQKR